MNEDIPDYELTTAEKFWRITRDMEPEEHVGCTRCWDMGRESKVPAFRLPWHKDWMVAYCEECGGLFQCRRLTAEETHEVLTHHMDKLQPREFGARSPTRLADAAEKSVRDHNLDTQLRIAVLGGVVVMALIITWMMLVMLRYQIALR